MHSARPCVHRFPRRRDSLRARRASGFTLIEGLVTIVVLSIGVLALMNLQLRTLADSRIASMRNVATQLAYNLADQIRSNEAALAAGVYKTNLAAKSIATCFTAVGCSSQEMAQASFQAWLDDTNAALPSGTGTVCIDSTPNDGLPTAPACDNSGTTYVIKVWWREGQAKVAGDTATNLSEGEAVADDHGNKADTRRFVTSLVP
jgi:type IV pilus assembly protein PilV